MSDLIDRQAAIDALWKALYEYEDKTEKQFIDSEELDVADWIQHRDFVQNMSDIDRQTILGLPSAQPETSIMTMKVTLEPEEIERVFSRIKDAPIMLLPSVQPEQRYTEEELRVFAHGISLSLLSKRSAQHWRYDKDTATEIEFLERLYDKVGADMKGGQG